MLVKGLETCHSRLARLVVPALLVHALSMDLAAQPVTYPASHRGSVVDTLHGVRVPDPFRWLESLSSRETTEWIAAQNSVTEGYLSTIPQRTILRERLTALWNYPRVTLPTRLSNGVLFYRRNSGLQKQFVVYARSSPSTPPKVILDPNLLSPDGSVALSQFEPSPDGRHVAYALSAGGADWEEVRIRQVRAGTDLPERLEWVRFSALSWTRDGKGFFYSRYPERRDEDKMSAALEHQKVYYHRLGTPQSDDRLVFERPDLPTWFVNGVVSEDGRYLWIYMAAGADTRNRLYGVDLGDPLQPNVGGRPTAIVDSDDGEYTVVGNQGSTVFLRTDLGAPRRMVVALSFAAPARERWRVVVPEGPHSIDDVHLTRSHLVVSRLVDVRAELSLHTIDGRAAGSVTLPGIGTVAGISTAQEYSGFYYAFTSPLYPTTIFRYDVATRKSTPFDPPSLQFDPAAYETHQYFAQSRDGTRIPFFVTHKVGLVRNGTNPTLLYGYGGFAVNQVPYFSPSTIAWMEQGGVFVSATLRGGGEYGEAWHQAGMRERKQRVFDDFIAVAEHLVKERFTAPRHLAIEGGSNGGLLVGAAMTQRPELFAVALPAVGVLDMLRYHKFTGGAAWASEYGSADDPAAFRYLLAYSPLHQLQGGTCYPATLVTTADHDDRVVPSHSFKFTAALQAAQGCANPVLIRVEQHGSHGYRPTDRLIAERADVLAFALARTRPR